MLQWDIGLVVLTEIDTDGFVGLQVDVPGEKKAGVAPGEMGFPYGVFGRPLDPELDSDGEPLPSHACGALYAYYGDRLHVFPQADPRMQAVLPRPGKGGMVFYGGTIAAPSWLHFKSDGSAEFAAGASPASVTLGPTGLTLGTAAGAVPVALATQLLAYLTALEAAIAAAFTATIPGGAAGAASFQGAMTAAATVRATIAATLVKGA